MIREVVKKDEYLRDSSRDCIPACHEGTGSAKRKLPVKYTVVGIQNNMLKEEWINY